MSVTDASGFQLAVNKWGRLARTLDQFTNTHQLILERTTELIQLLTEHGLRPFIVGGTLLGAVRDGELLPHDDDADLAYLSQHTDPTQVAIEHFHLSQVLREAGYSIVQHGGAHMQLHFDSTADSPQYYIDIFAAFFTDDGHINQPFHVRGPMRQDQLIPFAEVQIGEFKFPAPADTNAWLTVNYDRDWRTPIPGYRLRTKPRTQRRFQNWFGSFNFKRDFWTDFQARELEDPDAAQVAWDTSAQWLFDSRHRLSAPQLIEVGSGASTLAERLMSPTRRVVASDYLPRAAFPGASEGVEWTHLNILRLNILQVPQQLGFTGAFDLVANHVLEQTSHFARRNALRLIRMSCASGGLAVATVFTLPGRGVSFRNPTKWHVDPAVLTEEAASIGLKLSWEAIPTNDEYAKDREPYAVFFELSDAPRVAPDVPRDGTVSRMTSRLREWLAGRDQFEKLSKELSALERELDDRRRSLLATAEAAAIVHTDLLRTDTVHVQELVSHIGKPKA